MKKEEKIRKLEKKFEKKQKKKEKRKKLKKRGKTLWITAVIHGVLCVGNSKSPTRFSILVNISKSKSRRFSKFFSF